MSGDGAVETETNLDVQNENLIGDASIVTEPDLDENLNEEKETENLLDLTTEFAKINLKLDALLKWTGKSGPATGCKYHLPLDTNEDLTSWKVDSESDETVLQSAVSPNFIYLCA